MAILFVEMKTIRRIDSGMGGAAYAIDYYRTGV
jgi:hypothetical protein